MADDSGFVLFHYYPSLGAAILFSILFSFASILHTYQVIVTRTWFYICFLVGGYCKYLVKCPYSLS